MPISNTSVKERPAAERIARLASSVRASNADREMQSTKTGRRPVASRPVRRKDRKRPIRLLVGAGIYTLALATVTVTATELITNSGDQPDLAAAPATVAQVPPHRATHSPVYGPTLAPAPVLPSSTQPPAPAPAPKPLTKAGRAAAQAKLTASGSSADSVWDKLASCESSGRWSVHTGNGYYGGLQFKQSTWVEYGGRAYAPRANEASKADQIAVARKVLVGQGWRAWPACSRKTGVNKVPVSTVVDGQPTPATAPATVSSTSPAPAKPTPPSQPAPPSTPAQPTPPASQPPTTATTPPPTTDPAPTTSPVTTSPPTTDPAPTTPPVTTSPTPAQPVTTRPVSTPPVTAPAPTQPVSTPPVSMPSPPCGNDAGSTSCLAQNTSAAVNGLIRWAQSTALSPPIRHRS